MTGRRLRLRCLLAAALAVPALSGCGALALEKLPAPSGISGATYTVTAQFDDVLNLTVGAKVKLQGVVIGEVSSITTHDFQADVRMSISRKFPLATTATFQVRFTTPLGEDFVAASGNSAAGQPVLANGAIVAMAQTSDAPSIEDTFAALSLLLNGGGLDKIQTIAGELDAALKGRTGSVRDALDKLHTVIANFDANTATFDHVLTGLKSMAIALNSGTGVVDQALGEIPQTLQLLAQDTSGIRAVLAKVATLGNTVQSLLQRSQADMLADFDQLRPTLDAVAASESNLVPTFNALINFGNLINRAAPGDYLNIDATIEFLLNAPPLRPTVPASSASTATAAGAASPNTDGSSAESANASITDLLSGGLK